jgi:polyribonucleotide nucleotidyltransferase
MIFYILEYKYKMLRQAILPSLSHVRKFKISKLVMQTEDNFGRRRSPYRILSKIENLEQKIEGDSDVSNIFKDQYQSLAEEMAKIEHSTKTVLQDALDERDRLQQELDTLKEKLRKTYENNEQNARKANLYNVMEKKLQENITQKQEMINDLMNKIRNGIKKLY